MTHNDIEKIKFNKRFRNKLWLHFSRFPINSVRCFALRKCKYEIGEKVYIGKELTVATILGKKECKLILKDRVAVGPGVTFLLSSDANWSNLNKVFKPIRGKIIIEQDCWIGANVTVMPNVTIGESSVIGAGAVVTKDVPPYSVAVGIPAKVIRDIKK